MIAAAALALALAAPEHLGRPLATIEGLDEPAGVAVTDAGVLYVVERGAHRVRVLDAGGEELGAWGVRGTAPGELRLPAAIARATDGVLAIVDAGNARVQLVDPGGRVLAVLGARARGPARGPAEPFEPGELVEPVGVALAGDEVYVADAGSGRVEVFDRAGVWLRGLDGGADGLGRPAAVAVDAAGSVLVVDPGGGLVVKLDAAGRRVTAWGTRGPPRARFVRPAGIACDRGVLHVVDQGAGRVQVFGNDGGPLYAWGLPARRADEADGRLHAPTAVALSPDGRLAAVCEPWAGRVQVFARADGDGGAGRGDAHAPHAAPAARAGDHGGAGVALASGGRWLAVADPLARAVRVLDTTHGAPAPLGWAGGPGEALGRLRDAAGVAVDAQAGLLWVADPGAGRLHAYRLERSDAAARLSDELRLAWSVELARLDAGLAWPARADAVAADGGEVWALDRRNRVLVALDGDLRLARVVDLDAALGGAPAPVALALDAARGRLAVADELAGAFVLDLSGALLQRLPLPADTRPHAVAIAPDGSLAVACASTSRVHAFAPERATWDSSSKTWGSRGRAPGQWLAPRALASAPEGGWYVADPGNARNALVSADGVFRVGF